MVTTEPVAADALDRDAQALFEEARQRARRRRRRQAAAATVAATAVVAAAIGMRSGEHRSADRTLARASATAVPSKRVLAEPPYAGISCRTPDSIACDRIGLAVWLRRPARAVEASIAGRTIRLDDAEWSGRPRGGLRTMFAGFLNHADLRDLGVRPERGVSVWLGGHPVNLRVRLLIAAADGGRLTTTVAVPLAPGWG